MKITIQGAISLLHDVSVVATVVGVAAAKAAAFSDQAGALLASHQGSITQGSIVALAGAAVTYLMDKRGKDQLAQAVVNAAAVPTPTGPTIPTVDTTKGV